MNFWVDSMRIFGGLERNTSAVGRRLRFNLVILIVRILKKINENRNSQTSESCISMMRGRIDLKLVLKCRLDVVLIIPTFLGQSDKSPQNGARSTSSFPICSTYFHPPPGLAGITRSKFWTQKAADHRILPTFSSDAIGRSANREV